MSARDMAVLDFVRDEITNFGRGPTLDEIVAHTGITKTCVHQAITVLVRDGKLIRLPTRHRGLRLPDAVDLTPIGTDVLRGELARRGETFDALATPKPLRHEGRPCAATACVERVGMGRLFCGRHWSALPRDLRDDVLAAFYAKDAERYRDAVRQAIDTADAFNRIDRQVAA